MFGPPRGQTIKLVKQFDNDGNGWLNREERVAAREHLKKVRERLDNRRRGPGGFPRFGPMEAGKPGAKVRPEDVSNFPDKDLYEPFILRTFFLEFDSDDWEAELQDFHDTDVEVPALLTVDGQRYPNVGVRFRGMTSYMGVPMGLKRSFNLSLDLADKAQRLYGYKTLNFLNAHQDPSMMSSVLFSHIARQHIPCPKANFVKVVINGESWGVYANIQQFNQDFAKEHFGPGKGARWKVIGSPQADGGLRYLGENIDEYKKRYQIKSKDDPDSWKALIELCRLLDRTPLEQLEEKISPVLALDEVLRFLAVDVALCNSDGYWTRASDYCLYLDDHGKFHLVPHDFNEAFRGGMMPGRGGRPGLAGGRPRENPDRRPNASELPPRGFPPPPAGPGGFPPPPSDAGFDLDPLVSIDDPRKPLRNKLLAVSALRQRYLDHLRTIAETSLDWKSLGPVVDQFRQLIEDEVKTDTRKLAPYSEFQKAHGLTTTDRPTDSGTLRRFIEHRRQFLLNHPLIKKRDQPDPPNR